MTLTDEPIVVGDRFFVNLARTTPFEPCLLVTLPHTTRNLEPALTVCALYINATFFPK